MIEGAATVGVAILTFWLMPRSPTTAWWLSETQRAALLAGLQDDNTAYVEAKDETGLTEGLKVFWTNPVAPVYLCMNAASGQSCCSTVSDATTDSPGPLQRLLRQRSPIFHSPHYQG